uniref:Uncharacterized protein n=1 Tax=Glossina brevipalpis TaxID=37001 RepID=A0A1A9WI04_9MUSC
MQLQIHSQQINEEQEFQENFDAQEQYCLFAPTNSRLGLKFHQIPMNDIWRKAHLHSKRAQDHLNDNIWLRETEELKAKIAILELENSILKSQLRAQEHSNPPMNGSEHAEVFAKLICSTKTTFTETEESISKLLYMHSHECYKFMQMNLKFQLPEISSLNKLQIMQPNTNEPNDEYIY